MWVTLNYVLWGFLIISLITGFTRDYAKRIIQSLIWSRIFYFLIVSSQFVISIRIFHHSAVAVIISDVLCIASIALIERGYQKLEAQTFTRLDSLGLTLIILVAIIAQTIALK
ncbi:DUF1516 family protein [Nicoliella spurrieriana]|uniref:DUF1516 family protein n=1 Tax=Nicoliella spurrieriana TaxID=2925830 RepID=A0A976X573_9LACO|nr:DUF1516 family protein [Nicoliella spurrieriana]UQS86728.1 DUF1516 family protein [Nicoliella spurrieriana]